MACACGSPGPARTPSAGPPPPRLLAASLSRACGLPARAPACRCGLLRAPTAGLPVGRGPWPAAAGPALPARAVPVPPLSRAGGQLGPDHHVRHAGPDLLVTARAAVGLGGRGAGHLPDHPGSVRPVLDLRRAEPGRVGLVAGPGRAGPGTRPPRRGLRGCSSGRRRARRGMAGDLAAGRSGRYRGGGAKARPAAAYSASSGTGAKAGSPYRSCIRVSTASARPGPAWSSMSSGPRG